MHSAKKTVAESACMCRREFSLDVFPSTCECATRKVKTSSFICGIGAPTQADARAAGSRPIHSLYRPPHPAAAQHALCTHARGGGQSPPPSRTRCTDDNGTRPTRPRSVRGRPTASRRPRRRRRPTRRRRCRRHQARHRRRRRRHHRHRRRCRRAAAAVAAVVAAALPTPPLTAAAVAPTPPSPSPPTWSKRSRPASAHRRARRRRRGRAGDAA